MFTAEWIESQYLIWSLCRRSFFKNDCSTVHSLLLAQQWGSGAVKLTIQFSHTMRRKLSCFLHRQYVWNCREILSLGSAAHGGHRGKTNCKKAQNQRRLDALTEGVSFSSDLSLSPCSKNSLVTNSATWQVKKEECKAAANNFCTTIIFTVYSTERDFFYLARYFPGFGDSTKITCCHHHGSERKSDIFFLELIMETDKDAISCSGHYLHMSLWAFTFQLYSPLLTRSKKLFLFLEENRIIVHYMQV